MGSTLIQHIGAKIYKGSIWHGRRSEKTIYLTFDDGPHPSITNEVLSILDKYSAKATFFCVGKNLEKHSEVANLIQQKEHLIANHTWSHPNGWFTNSYEYILDVKKGMEISHSHLFRPPYGKIKYSVYYKLKLDGIKTIFWDNITCDYDKRISPQSCFKNTLNGVKNGSIIVFHDSEKAAKNMLYTLPLLLEYLSEKEYSFKHLGSLVG
jgi:peptidoglycan-N-acetylglucosamine deacetylase